ncbi:NYN domain-containing protein [Hydrogenophaga sp. MI9]|uniref:NYN domain-containing protein n=1 Tax=Hydrogenophaga sp. MI9 TaxID=3453719 RepID=UPI003EEE62EE
MIVFLIDADNLSSPAWVNEAITAIEATEGPVAVRRAYGSAENLKGLAESLRDWAIRPFLNVYLTKNTTDMALAVDAMELACQQPQPTTLVIGSGDADFVPLVVRLRERGIKVLCASEYGKMAPEAVKAYDKVIYVGRETAATGSTDAAKSAKPRAAAKAAASSSKKAPKAATKKAPAEKKIVTKKQAATTNKVTPEGVLEAVPSLRTGEWFSLGEAAKALHDKELLGRNSSSAKLFGKFPHHFELKPAKQPNHVRFLLPSA